MEEKIRELEHKVEVLSGVIFILLKETGLLDKALSDGDLLKTIVQNKEEVRQDKSTSKQKEDKFTSILRDFDSKDAIKN